MGAGSSKEEFGSEAVGLFNQCREMYEKELRNTLKELDRIKEDYVRKGKRPYNMQESPEVNAVIQKIANRTMFCSVAGGGISYLIAREFTRYHARLPRILIRTNVAFIGFMIGSSYGAWTSVVSHAAEYLQKSRWSPRLICPPIAQFKPCIDDYACRSMMEKDRWASVIIDCYRVCESRMSERPSATTDEGGSDGFGGDGGGGFADDQPPAGEFEEPAFTTEEELMGDQQEKPAQAAGRGGGSRGGKERVW